MGMGMTLSLWVFSHVGSVCFCVFLCVSVCFCGCSSGFLRGFRWIMWVFVGIPLISCGNEMGMGFEILFSRQPWGIPIGIPTGEKLFPFPSHRYGDSHSHGNPGDYVHSPKKSG